MTTAKKPMHVSARKMAGRMNSRRWHAKPKEPDQWFGTPASPVRSITRDDPEWYEIAQRYGVAS
jgi:hypothetical protein